ncbi:hypothetical protein SMICM17S_05396 [Streptomyces microflavus]
MKYHMEKVAEPIRNIDTLRETARTPRNTRSGISGTAVRASTRTNAASSTAPESSGTRVAAAEMQALGLGLDDAVRDGGEAGRDEDGPQQVDAAAVASPALGDPQGGGDRGRGRRSAR